MVFFSSAFLLQSCFFCRFFKRETGMTPTEYRKREMCVTTILSLS